MYATCVFNCCFVRLFVLHVIADAMFVYYVCFIYDLVDTDMNDEWQMA